MRAQNQLLLAAVPSAAGLTCDRHTSRACKRCSNEATLRVPRQDFCANYKGQEVWLNALDWERASEWQATLPEVWEVDGERAGTVQAAEPLTYVKLDGSGHLVRLALARTPDPWHRVLPQDTCARCGAYLIDHQ